MPEQTNKNARLNSLNKIPFSGWKTILLKVKDENEAHNLSIVAAGIGFYAFLAVFPAIIALVSIYGLAMDPQQIEQQIASLAGMMPQEAFDILQKQIENFVSSSGEKLSWGVAISILISLWSANAGTKSLFTGLEIAYASKNKRGFFKQNGLTLLFTFGVIILGILSLTFIVAFPAFIDNFGLPQTLEIILSWARWLILAAILVFFLCMVYRFAPDRKEPKMKWVIVGAVFAAILWLVASWGFPFYVSNFGSYGKVYGSIASVIIFLLWLYLTCFIILLGGELNAEIESYAKTGIAKKPPKN